MIAFLEVIKLHLKIFFQYKWGFAITLLIQPFSVLINVALFSSIYKFNGTSSIKGYSLDQMIWYFTVINFIWAFIWNFTDGRIANKILTGDLSIDLLKPISLFRFELGNAIALRIVGVLMEFVPGVVLYSLIYYPQFLTVFSLMKFILVVMFSFTLFYLLNFLIGLLAFVIKNNSSLTTLKMLFISLAGGAFMPLEFFPAWVNRIIDFFPFKYMFYWPIQFFLNKAGAQELSDLLRVLSIQTAWILVMYISCKIFWNKAASKFCAVGG